MAGMGRGIGAFMDGFVSSAKAAEDRADKEWRRAYLERQEQDALFDRQRRIIREDEMRPGELEKQKLELEGLRDLRANQREERARQDKARSAQDAAYQAGVAARDEDIGRSMKPIEAQGPTQDGRALPAWEVYGRTFTEKGRARAEAEKHANSVFSYISGKHVDDVVQAALQAGNVDFAQTYPKWIKSEQVQAGARHFADAIGAYSAGDIPGFLSGIERAYNARGYFDDGGKIEVTNVKKDPSGKIIGADIVHTDAAGKTQTQAGMSLEDLYRAATNFLAPDKVLEHGLAAVKGKDAADAEVAKEIAKKRGEAQIKRDETAAGGNPYAAGGFNEGQGKAASFADRMAEAEGVIGQHEDINSGVSGWIGGVAANALPSGVANQLASPERQQVVQAQRSFINAILRRESGAVISDAEFDNARRQYFPQPGDSADVVAQKRQNRTTAIQGMMREAGPSYRPPGRWADPSGAKSEERPAAAAAPGASIARNPNGNRSPAKERAILGQARDAIAKGADPAAVAARLKQLGLNPEGL